MFQIYVWKALSKRYNVLDVHFAWIWIFLTKIEFLQFVPYSKVVLKAQIADRDREGLDDTTQ